MKCKLIAAGFAGNTFDACAFYNQLGLAEHVVNMQSSESHTVTVFKVPDEQVPAVWRKLGRTSETCPVQHMKEN